MLSDSEGMRKRLSCERGLPSKKHPNRPLQLLGGLSYGHHACPICDGPHPAWLCLVPIDPAMPASGPIGTIEGAPEKSHTPAGPLEAYRGPGRVLVLRPGVSGSDLDSARGGLHPLRYGRTKWDKAKIGGESRRRPA